MNQNLSRFAIALSMSVPLLALAQAPGAKPEPMKPAPPLRYQSAFDDYKPYREIPLADWRGVNDAVAGAGGHAGHDMSGMAMPAAPASAASAASAPRPMKKPGGGMPSHEGHGMHGAKP
jgi:hypothetical protein